MNLVSAQATNLGLSLWWTPARAAVHAGQAWQTISYPHFTTTGLEKQSVAVSPIGMDRKCHFVAWDIDSGNVKDLQGVLKALPSGTMPLVSLSGRKGWHVWVFPDKPISLQNAVSFAGQVREKAGIDCEVFPSSVHSRCLKWPGQRHPQTGEVEAFVDPADSRSSYDVAAVLQGLADEMWRTPAAVIQETVGGIQAKDMAVETLPPPYETGKPREESRKVLSEGVSLATLEDLALGLAKLAGRKVSRIGQGFRCILPGHDDGSPSAAFYRTEDRRIMYHDFHRQQEWYTLGEVYSAIQTGEVKKLRPVYSARWLAKLALDLGYRTPLAVNTEKRLLARNGSSSWGVQVLQPTGHIRPVGCRNIARRSLKKRVKRRPQGFLEVERVWSVFSEEAMISAMAGFEEVKLSKRFLAARAGIPGEVANRAMNLLCVLGILAKVPGGERGDRFKLCDPDPGEVKRRWDILGRPSLREFKQTLVAEKLGTEIANAVFRRVKGFRYFGETFPKRSRRVPGNGPL